MPDPKLFESLGKIAGIAGICIGLVLLVFLAILKKDVKNQNQYSLLRQMMYLTFAIGVIGIIAWFFSRGSGHSITGRVSDQASRMGVADAEIILSGRPESTHSDGAGNFSLTLAGTIPDGLVHLYISKAGYRVYDRGVGVGQNIEVELTPVTEAEVRPHIPAGPTTDSVPILTVTETYTSGDVASGACKDMGAWSTVCTPDKPANWTIAEQHFQITGDRAGGAYARAEPLGSITQTKACYRFQTQGHDEECGHSGNTGIHYSQGVLTVTWKHP